MRRPTAVVRLTEEKASKLKEWARRRKSEQRVVERARIILLANEGRTNEQIATELEDPDRKGIQVGAALR
jgi:hypothetical protein